jgi:hypothetical protein
VDGIEIRELTPSLLEDYLYFMEHDAFGGNPDWAGCYCLEGHSLGTDEEENETDEERRVRITELITADAHHGLLAYAGERVVGWCHASPLVALVNPEYRLGRSDEEVAGVGAIVCFNLAASHQSQGLPGVFLREACRRFAAAGLTEVEAYPWKDPSPKPRRNYLGTVSLYEIHSFTNVGDAGDAFVMRRSLGPRDAK